MTQKQAQNQQRLDIEEVVKYLREQIGGLSYNNAILKAQAVTLEKEKAQVEERLKHTEDLNKALEEKADLLEQKKPQSPPEKKGKPPSGGSAVQSPE